MKKYLLIFTVSIGSFLIFSFGTEYYLQTRKNMNFDQWLNDDLYSGDFCEDRFPVRSEMKQIYQSYVEKGYEQMTKSRVVVCGLARDIADNIPTISKRIEQMGTLFKEYKVLVFENDSADETRALCYEWQKNNQQVYVIETGVKDNKFGDVPLYLHGVFSRNRIARMAHFRNYYLQEIEKKYTDYDYMLVVDMDLKGPWSLDGLAHTFGHSDWDMVGSYGLVSFPGTCAGMYALYDPLAYISKYESQETEIDATTKTLAKKYLHLNFIELRNVQKGDDFIPVKSCFAGIGVYKMESIQGCRYEGGRCEHIEFHKQMAKNGHGKIFMNPSQILLSGHQGPRDLSEVFTHSTV